MLIPFSDKIWTCRADLKVFGAELGTQMTIVDLDGQGTLFVHSPVKLSSEIKRQLDALGVVKFVIAPNKWHHLFIGDFKAAYPQAKFYCAPGLEVKRADFKFDAVIGREQTYPWNPSLEHKLIDGVPVFNEVVFFHPPTRTLILTDLAFHICESKSLLTRTILKLIGLYGKFGWAKIEKALYVRDKAAFRKSLDNVLHWEIERILVTHGKPIMAGGKKRLEEAFL